MWVVCFVEEVHTCWYWGGLWYIIMPFSPQKQNSWLQTNWLTLKWSLDQTVLTWLSHVMVLETAINNELHVFVHHTHQWGTYIKEQKLQYKTEMHCSIPYMHIFTSGYRWLFRTGEHFLCVCVCVRNLLFCTTTIDSFVSVCIP